MASTDSVLTTITNWTIDLVAWMGSPGAGVATAIENILPFIPSEVTLPATGVAAGQGKINLVAALVWTTAGSIIGALVLYYIGQLAGRDRVVRLVAKIPLIKLDDVEKAERWFGRHGGGAVFLGRFIPGIRALISLPAGLERMNPLKFVAFTALGSGIWNCFFILCGYKLGKNWTVIETYVNLYSKVIIALLVVLVIVAIALRIRTLRREKARAEGGETPETPEPPTPDGPESHGDGYYRSVRR
ncbi:MAG TPA: DedA family protein [Stackebrandtia sp.]|uniref:DedA family protein n=1 Tax=Stackebrandtia sp. TaxID=2023065 RepID=UPI002D688B52|nr:DedA family protein [Stackebrandtia sp.]HZE39391.1 DedA family protein [Stackebrandtia sp.]